VGNERLIERGQAFRAETEKGRMGAVSIGEQPGDVDGHAGWSERTQIAHSTVHQCSRTAVVPPAQMIKGDAYLQNALVEIANWVTFFDPGVLERLMLLEEQPSIELVDPL